MFLLYSDKAVKIATACLIKKVPMSDKSYKPEQATLEQWREMATKQMKGKTPEELTWNTAEGIDVKCLYTQEDIADLEYTNTLPGTAPYIRGPQATMYAGRPWTIRQYAGFSTAKSPMLFTVKPWRPVARVFQWPLIWPRTAVTTPTIHESLVMSVRLALRLTQ
jgi:hypothetical protein